MFKWIKDKFGKNKNVDEKIEVAEEKLEELEEELEEKKEEAKEKFDELKDNAENKYEDTRIKTEEKYKEVKKEVEDTYEEKKAEAIEKYEDTKEKAEEKFEEIKEDAKLKREEASEIIEEKKEDLEEKTEDIKENIEEKIEEKKEEKPKPKKVSLFQKLKEGLGKTRKEVGIKINTVLGQYVKIDDEMLEDLEDILISADIGMQTTMKLIDNLRDTIIREKINDPSRVKEILKVETKKLMDESLNTKIESTPPTIILVVGVNGVGKTTTIGKLSHRFKEEGKSVIVAAADTFRAAAIDQLKEWGKRADVDVISHSEGSDPAAVVYDGIEAAKSRKIDILICDTAGRLHNKKNLMSELEKINRIIETKYPEANKETLLVLDATTGQNAMNQAKTFKEASDISAIALTKLDGTAKGGVVIALQSELKVPIKLVGVGEGIEDLQDFNIDDFVEAIFEE